MIWLLTAGAALALLVWWGRRRGGDVRPAAAVVALVALTGAAIAGVRQEWLLAAVLLAMAAGLAISARRR